MRPCVFETGYARRAALRATALLVACAATAAAQSMRPRDVDSLPSKPADVRLAYGGDSLQFGELRLPRGDGPYPLAIVIHGGCWVSHFASLRNTAALSDALRDKGVATWNIEYRRLDHPGGGWPGTYQDVAAAADFVRTFAARYHIDTSRVIAMGHSAGGHLALWLAGRHHLQRTSMLARSAPLPLVGVADLGGPGDLADFSKYASSICGDPVIDQLMGGSPTKVPDRYAQGSPRQLLPLGVRQVLIVGAQDGVMPQASRDAYVSAARAAGDSVELAVVPNAGHFEVIAPTSSAWPTVSERVLSLVPRRVQSPRIVGPDTVAFTSGSLTLHGIIYRPAGNGPFPTILFNHGSGKSYTKEVEAVGPTYAGLGFVFFAPSRRGQWLSASTGHYIVDSLDAIEKLKGAGARDPLLVELMKGPQLADVRAALSFIKSRPYVRKDRVVVAGNSFGGIVTIFASAHIDGLWAALDFAGAAQTWASAPQLQAAMTDAATHSRIPIFFGQAANDYDLSPSRVLSAAMLAAGKPNLMKIFPAFGTTTPEGHSFGYFGGATWGPEVSAFVKSPPTGRAPSRRDELEVPASAYAARRAALARQVVPGAVIMSGKYLVGQHELPRQDENFWYLTGVESPYAILVMAPDRRATAARGDVRTALFLPDTFEFAGAQMPMVDSGFRRAAWNQPRHRLAPGAGAAGLTGIPEMYPLSEFVARAREIVGDSPKIYLGQSTDSLYAPPGVVRPLTVEQQTSRAIADLFPGRSVNDATPLVKKMRLVKDQYEIAALRAAAGASAQSMIALMHRVKPGMNDLEAAGILEAEWKRLGAPRASFGPIVSSGPKAMTFFSLAGESYDAVGRVMQAGDLLFNDYGAAEVRHYASDICRTFPVSGTFTAEQRTYYDIVLEAQEAAIAAVKPGVMMLDVIKAAARVYRAHGLEKYEDVAAMGAAHVWGVMPSPTHYLARNGGITSYTRFGGGVRDIGHHVGLNATDSRDWSEPLAPGMVVTIEPKIYIPDKNIAIMIEDMILVTPAGHDNLSLAAPKKAEDIERVMRRQ